MKLNKPTFEEHFGAIIKSEQYFDHNDAISRLKMEIIGKNNRVQVYGTTSDFEMLVEFLNKEIDKANKVEYIH